MPSDADIDAAKKIAASRGARAALLPFPDVEACAIALTMTPADWSRYVDTRARNSDDAISEAYANLVVWPAPAEADDLAERIPAFTKLVIAELCAIAGSIPTNPEVCKLDANTSPLALARAGLATEKAAALLAQYNHPGQLKIARFPLFDMSKPGAGFSLVVKVPPRAVYNARVSVHDKAVKECSGILDTCMQAARDFIVWTSEGDNPDPIFAAWPACVSADIYPLFETMGGITAKCDRRML